MLNLYPVNHIHVYVLLLVYEIQIDSMVSVFLILQRSPCLPGHYKTFGDDLYNLFEKYQVSSIISLTGASLEDIELNNAMEK